MKTIAWGILVAALVCGAGCARPDWIEQTLVTVDVTGTWQGSVVHPAGSSLLEFTLEQQGPKVKGSVRASGVVQTAAGPISGPIEGTVAGDALSFRQTTGSLRGEMTVSGDEMTGLVSGPLFSARPMTLRRVSLRSPQISN